MSSGKLEDRQYIYLNENYRVTTDSLNYILQVKKVTADSERTTDPGKIYWVDISYQGKIEYLFQSMSNHVILDNIGDFSKIQEAFNQFNKDIETKLKLILDARAVSVD